MTAYVVEWLVPGDWDKNIINTCNKIRLKTKTKLERNVCATRIIHLKIF
jgi:hypothetical protein